MALGLAGPALAQAYPTKPITIIVSFAAGGPSDVIARLLGEQMSKTLGQPVVVENVAGAGGTAGAKRLAAAEPDGHTLLIHHLALAAAPALYGNLGYDTKTDFAPIGLVNTGPMVIASKLALPPQDAKAFFPYIKENAEKLTHRPCRRRLELASLRRADVAAARRQVHPGRLSRHGSGHERSRRRPDRHSLRPVDLGDPADPGQEDPRLCGDLDRASRRAAEYADR